MQHLKIQQQFALKTVYGLNHGHLPKRSCIEQSFKASLETIHWSGLASMAYTVVLIDKPSYFQLLCSHVFNSAKQRLK